MTPMYIIRVFVHAVANIFMKFVKLCGYDSDFVQKGCEGFIIEVLFYQVGNAWYGRLGQVVRIVAFVKLFERNPRANNAAFLFAL